MPQKKFEVGETVYFTDQHGFFIGRVITITRRMIGDTYHTEYSISKSGVFSTVRDEGSLFHSLEELIQYYTEKLNRQS